MKRWEKESIQKPLNNRKLFEVFNARSRFRSNCGSAGVDFVDVAKADIAILASELT